jgi:hypothetical protein
MARHPVTELWVQRQGATLVRVSANAPAEVGAEKSDLRTWVDRSGVPAGGLVAGGLALSLTGLALAALVGWSGLGVAAIYSAMITVGGGLAFLGLVKRKQPPPPALPAPRTSAEVQGERARRVHVALMQQGDATFETLLRLLGWTEPALLETLVYMKEGGAIEEDLNLDTGEWIYRSRNDLGMGVAGGLMLEDRQARQR